MSHYFENDKNLKSEEKIIFAKIGDEKLSFFVDHGVFSKKGLDFGTRSLLENIKEGKTMELQKVQRTTLTMKEAAEYLGISYWLVNQLVRRKQIPCSKVGGKYLFRVQALDEYLENMEQQSIS